MPNLNTITRQIAIILVLASSGLIACDDDNDVEEEVAQDEVEEVVEEEEEEEEEEIVEPEADSSFTYIPFHADQDIVEQEGHAMAYLTGDADDADDFRVIIAPTNIEFICGNPNMAYRGGFADEDTALTMIAAEGFSLETGDHEIEFFNVRNIGVDVNQDLRFEITEISDDEIIGHIARYDEDDLDDAQFSGEFRANRCNTD